MDERECYYEGWGWDWWLSVRWFRCLPQHLGRLCSIEQLPHYLTPMQVEILLFCKQVRWMGGWESVCGVQCCSPFNNNLAMAQSSIKKSH